MKARKKNKKKPTGMHSSSASRSEPRREPQAEPERATGRHPGETEYDEEAATADQRAGVAEKGGVHDPTDPYLNQEASRVSLVHAVDYQVYDDGTTGSDEVVDPRASKVADNDLGFTLVDTNSNRVQGNALDPELSPDSLTLGTNAEQVIESMDEWTEDQEVLDDFAERQRMSTDADHLLERLQENTHVTPDLTGDDIDADWERAEQVGEEAVGGSVPTPGQDIVEELGEAAGLTYRDDEPLHTGDKLEQRDSQRWELDPRSAEANPEDLDDGNVLTDRLADEDLEDAGEYDEFEEMGPDAEDILGEQETVEQDLNEDGVLIEDDEDLVDEDILDENIVDDDILDDDDLTDLTFLN